MKLFITLLFFCPVLVRAQFTFAKAQDLSQVVLMGGFEGNQADVLDKLKTIYMQGYMLQSYTMINNGSVRSDTFALADLNGDAINEHITLGFGFTTFNNRAVPLTVVTVTTDNLTQYLNWMTDIEQSRQFEKKIYEPFMSTYLYDDRLQQTGLIVSVPYTSIVNNPPSKIKRNAIPNQYTLVVSRMIKPLIK